MKDGEHGSINSTWPVRAEQVYSSVLDHIEADTVYCVCVWTFYNVLSVGVKTQNILLIWNNTFMAKELMHQALVLCHHNFTYRNYDICTQILCLNGLFHNANELNIITNQCCKYCKYWVVFPDSCLRLRTKDVPPC